MIFLVTLSGLHLEWGGSNKNYMRGDCLERGGGVSTVTGWNLQRDYEDDVAGSSYR